VRERIRRYARTLVYVVFSILSLTIGLWQLEIADLCWFNNWNYQLLFQAITIPHHLIWAVRDFWMVIIAFSPVFAFLTGKNYLTAKRRRN